MRRVAAALLTLALYVSSTASTSADSLGYVPKGEAYEYTLLVPWVSRWDPCHVIGWRVRTRDARPNGALADTRAAFWRLGQVTGLTFRYRGHTAGIPQWDSHAWFPADTQIVIAWAPPWRSTLFTVTPEGDAVAGAFYLGGYHNTDGTPAERIARAGVVIDSRLRLHGGYGRGITRGDMLLHELGHVMGLGHYESTDEAMNPYLTRGPARFGRGDLAGLTVQGARAGCLIHD